MLPNSLEAIWVYIIIGWLVLALAIVVVILYLRSRRKRVSGEQTQPTRTRAPITPDAAQEALGDEFGLQFILDSGTVTTIGTLPVTIGRGEQNDLVIDDDTVSDEHARVYYDKIIGAVCIHDLNSVNGTWIDDLPTRKNILHDGVKLRLGSVELGFRDTGYIHPE